MEDPQEMETDLIKQLKNGHPQAFRILVDQWQNRMFNYALRFTNDHQIADDIVQKAFIKVYENIGSLQDHSKFKSWFYSITNNLCISEKRKQKVRKKYITNAAILPIARDGKTPLNIFEKEEKGKMVHLALQKLSPEQRQVILMKEFEGMKFREIAEVLEESESTIKSRLYYGLDNLKKIMTTNKQIKEMYYE